MTGRSCIKYMYYINVKQFIGSGALDQNKSWEKKKKNILENLVNIPGITIWGHKSKTDFVYNFGQLHGFL